MTMTHTQGCHGQAHSLHTAPTCQVRELKVAGVVRVMLSAGLLSPHAETRLHTGATAWSLGYGSAGLRPTQAGTSPYLRPSRVPLLGGVPSGPEDGDWAFRYSTALMARIPFNYLLQESAVKVRKSTKPSRLEVRPHSPLSWGRSLSP